MRADALSSLAEEERKIADERRREFAERERAAGVELADALAVAARRVDERLRAWGDDLDRAQQSLETDLRRLEQRQKQLIADAEARIEAEASELVDDLGRAARIGDPAARGARALGAVRRLRGARGARGAHRRAATGDRGDRRPAAAARAGADGAGRARRDRGARAESRCRSRTSSAARSSSSSA